MWEQIRFLNFISIFDTLNCVSAGGLNAVAGNTFTVWFHQIERGWSCKNGKTAGKIVLLEGLPRSYKLS